MTKINRSINYCSCHQTVQKTKVNIKTKLNQKKLNPIGENTKSIALTFRTLKKIIHLVTQFLKGWSGRSRLFIDDVPSSVLFPSSQLFHKIFSITRWICYYLFSVVQEQLKSKIWLIFNTSLLTTYSKCFYFFSSAISSVFIFIFCGAGAVHHVLRRVERGRGLLSRQAHRQVHRPLGWDIRHCHPSRHHEYRLHSGKTDDTGLNCQKTFHDTAPLKIVSYKKEGSSGKWQSLGIVLDRDLLVFNIVVVFYSMHLLHLTISIIPSFSLETNKVKLLLFTYNRQS